MQNEQQFEQLMMQYTQLKNGSIEMRKAIESENFDEAISMLNMREKVFLNCKSMRNYLELTEFQEQELNNLLDELRTLESDNIQFLQEKMAGVKSELKQFQQKEKIQQAYDFNENLNGTIINIQE